jgi:hypothetical protein
LSQFRSDGSRGIVRWEAGPGGRRPKTLKGKLISSFSLPGNYMYLNGQSDNLKKDTTYSSLGNVKERR